MTNKHFNAILAKNNIARAIRDYKNAPQGSVEPLSIIQIISDLCVIETYMGEGNQPSVNNIYDSSMNL